MENSLQKEALHIVNYLEKNRIMPNWQKGEWDTKTKKIHSIYQIRGNLRLYLISAYKKSLKHRLNREKISIIPKKQGSQSLNFLKDTQKVEPRYRTKSQILKKTVFFKTANIASARKQVKSIKTLLSKHNYNYVKLKARLINSKTAQNEEIRPHQFEAEFNINRITDFNRTD